MACDEPLAARVRALLGRKRGYAERKMFGGICFLLHKRMCAGVLGENLIVRATADEYPDALNRPHTAVFDFTGRAMKGFVVVGPKGCDTTARLGTWIGFGLRGARASPAKRARPKALGARAPTRLRGAPRPRRAPRRPPSRAR